MKKAKILFSAIAVVAVVSGALAFKAHNYTNQTTLYTEDPAHPGTCNQGPIVTSTVSSGTANHIKASTSSGTSNCVTFTTTTGEGQ